MDDPPPMLEMKYLTRRREEEEHLNLKDVRQEAALPQFKCFCGRKGRIRRHWGGKSDKHKH